jgi:hypothetical protein
MTGDPLGHRYLLCRLALDFLRRHGRPPRNACVRWERIFNALHPTHSLSTIQGIDAMVAEFSTELGLVQETERLRKAVGEPQTAFVEVIEMRPPI